MNKCLCFALIVYSQKYAIFSKDFLYLLILFEGLNSEEKCDSWPVEKCSIKKKKVKKFIPDTKCTKTPREVCTKGGCALKEVKIIDIKLFYLITLSIMLGTTGMCNQDQGSCVKCSCRRVWHVTSKKL